MAMENVSNCQLVLTVEVKKIAGTLALNIPPHPSDRIWYGFVDSPTINLVATPQVGEKEVSYSAVSDWIADKLKSEFQVSFKTFLKTFSIFSINFNIIFLFKENSCLSKYG